MSTRKRRFRPQDADVPSYAALKAKFERSPEQFARFAEGSEVWQRAIVRMLALADQDGGWPLEMLKHVRPRLAWALCSYTAGGYEDIRRAQECGEETELVAAFESEFCFLPKWHAMVRHTSKDDMWYRLVSSGNYCLRSFLSCSSGNGSFAYVSSPAVTILVKSPKSARLIGGLSSEYGEKEVVFPRGTCFRVKRIDDLAKTIEFEEVQSRS